MKKNTLYAIIAWTIIIGILLAFSYLRNNAIGEKECPEKILGNQNASFSIKYFESPFCVYCWFEEPIIKELVEEKGSLFSIAYYDVRFCTEESAQYQVYGTPTFAFSIDGKDYVQYGFTPKNELLEIICQGSGGC